MNTLDAAQDTLANMRPDRSLLPKEGDCSWVHIESMVARMRDPSFSYGKRCRWLGYIQGVAVACGLMSLDELKVINMRHAGSDL